MQSRDNIGSEFGTFWHGPLNPFVYSCLSSFPRNNAKLCIYSYHEELDVPDGVEVADARQICPDKSIMGRYIADGRPSIPTFADMFRYHLIQQTGCCWVDTDILCLKRPEFTFDEYVFGHQSDSFGTSLINNAVLKLPRSDAALGDLISASEDALDKDQRWGAIGPFLLTKVLGERGLDWRARDFRAFYSVEPEQFWKPFLPAYRETVEEVTKGASFLHLWSESIAWSGFDVTTCPPAGSFLHGIFQQLGTLDRFTRICDVSEVSHLEPVPNSISGTPETGLG